MKADRAGSSWYVGTGFFFAPVLAVVAPWHAVTVVIWVLVALVGLGLFAPAAEKALSGAGWQDSTSESVTARDLVQVFLQCGQQNSRLAAAGKVGSYILGAKAHGFQLFDLQNAGHVVVVVIAASAVRRGVGGRQQTLFL